MSEQWGLMENCCAGFMSNRGRQNVASYLALDLGIDWRMVSSKFLPAELYQCDVSCTFETFLLHEVEAFSCLAGHKHSAWVV